MSELQKCTEFLLQAKVITEKFDKLFKKQGLNFNIFQILDRKTSEVKGHSAFLSELLNPGGTHGQENLFLNLFFDHIINLNNERGLSFSFQENLKQDKDWTVRTERGAGKWGRIDITIEAKDCIIVIENKIYAEDRKSQLSDYYKWAKGLKKKHFDLIYLSLDDESKPDDKSFLGGDGQSKLDESEVFYLTYDSFIEGWIQECIKASVTLPHIRETLIQYQIILRQLTGCGENDDMTIEIVDLIIKDNNMRAALKISEALAQAKFRIQLNFWNSLKEKLKEKMEWTDEKFLNFKMYNENFIKNFYNNKEVYGISIKIENLDDEFEIIHKIELFDNIYFVFYLREKSKDIYYSEKGIKYESLKKIIEKMNKGYLFQGTGVAWRYPFPGKTRSFRKKNEAYEDFVNEKELEKYTDELSDEFISDVKDFKELYKQEIDKCS